ncbi:IS1 family transposase [Empedobacter falsenii]|uniref:DDE domain-containing protein n=1 Tax=Empedobacter falsenii TaxID=343874 RepID=A0AAW7DQA0_9FLAO|nr:hypothetical protein [Empedobacter falsenii]
MLFHVGYRTVEIFKKLLRPIIQTKPTKIYTDKLNTYNLVIPSSLHSTRFRSTNHIERNHLSLRTHLKRLNRKHKKYNHPIRYFNHLFLELKIIKSKVRIPRGFEPYFLYIES